MKKSDKLARKTRKMIAKNLIVLAVLATVAFAGVVSWFTQHTTATASGVSVVTQVADGLEFYIMPPSDGDQYDAINARLAANAAYNTLNPNETPRQATWHTSSDGSVLFDTTSQEFKFMEGLFLCDVTGDGKTFSIPKLMQYDEIAYVDTAQNFDTPTPNNEYMSFDIYFRSENENDVKLLSGSSISPNTSLSSGSYSNVSQNPDAFKDAAIGAVRMAVYNGNDRELLWIPGPYVYYNGVDDTLYAGLTSEYYSNKGAAYFNGSAIALRTTVDNVTEGTNTHTYYNTSKQLQIIGASNLVAGEALASDTSSVLTLDTNNNDGYYHGHIRVNLWIEGEDAEARLAFVGGKFSMALNFGMIINNNNS